jgi:hypothetical protein
MATNGYARIGGVNSGVKLVDINPNKAEGAGAPYFCVYQGIVSTLPISGYKKIALQRRTSDSESFLRFKSSDGSTISSIPSTTANTWTNYVDIPDNAVILETSCSSSGHVSFNYSLLA